ncbi:MAG: DnaA/Hda family protein, partial [Phycisphaerae bacterium]|nr:DnaA/Hda family protein [Phycisphaerae bacterium]
MANGITARRWKSLLEHVRREQADLWQPWFEGLQVGELNNGQLCVHANDAENAYYLEASCRRSFAEAAQAVLGRLVSVQFVGPPGQEATGPLPAPTIAAQPPGSAFAIDEPVTFNPAYTFENFITGPGNRLAHAAAIAVADTPGVSYNPLFVHGSVGLGKTHLLQAICQGLLAKRQDCRICYLSCDSFINHFIASVEQGQVHNFRYRYRHVDVLVIDDVHFLGERERTQDEFFHTFNTLYQAQKQIVLSSDCSP